MTRNRPQFQSHYALGTAGRNWLLPGVRYKHLPTSMGKSKLLRLVYLLHEQLGGVRQRK